MCNNCIKQQEGIRKYYVKNRNARSSLRAFFYCDVFFDFFQFVLTTTQGFVITYANESQMLLRQELKDYITKQRKLILDLLGNSDYMTADDIFVAVKNDGVSISTVYRNLDKLVQNNRVIRELTKDGSKSLYRLNKTAFCTGHLHLVCSRCGNVIHISDNDTSKLGDSVMSKYGFSIDEQSSFITGLCQKCKNL